MEVPGGLEQVFPGDFRVRMARGTVIQDSASRIVKIDSSVVLSTSPTPTPLCVCWLWQPQEMNTDFSRDFNQYCDTEDCQDGVEGCGRGSVLSMFIVHCFKMVLFACLVFGTWATLLPDDSPCLVFGTRATLLSDDSPVTADEEVLSVGGPDGHHLIGVALKHLLYGSHFFMVTYANVYTGISVRYRHKVSNTYTHKIRKNTG